MTMWNWGMVLGGPGPRGVCQKQTWPPLPFSQGQLSTLSVRISHKQLLHLKSRSSLGWCHSDDSVTHGPRRCEGQRDGQRSCWASQMLWGLACLQPPHLAAGALRKKNHRQWKVGQEAGNGVQPSICQGLVVGLWSSHPFSRISLFV